MSPGGGLLPLHGGGHADGAPGVDGLPLLAVLALALVYAVLVARRSAALRGWKAWRTASFLLGCALLAAAAAPEWSPWPPHGFATHMLQHLLIGMYAPLFLSLGAPLTLVLGSVSRRWGKRIVGLLRTPALRFLAHPVTAAVLNVGGLAGLYFTPLYSLALRHGWVHALVHVHFLAAGYLFAYSISGADPAPHRPSVPCRLVVLGVAVTAHALLAQALYGGLWTQAPVPPAERRAGADLMYYGGDLAELALALAMVSTWRPRTADRLGCVTRLRPQHR